ncbi:hypothetical protein [Vibrio anguillarum]|uniref:hypothetical protein n=1 Tax=Vibrio anguillarum TaxID=55601 RepID=UPI002FE4602E
MMFRTKKIENNNIVTFLLCMVFFVVVGIIYPSFSTDSWGYHELSISLSDGNYNTNIIRQYSVDSDRSISFPFLYPGILLIFSFLGLGIYTGLIVNTLILFSSFYIIYNYFGDRKYFGILSLVLVINYDFLYEVISGRSIPLALFLTICVYITLTRSKYNFTLLFMGLLCLNRFDAYPFVFLLVLFVFFYCGYKQLIQYIPFLLLSSIWPIYSFSFFGDLFITENSVIFSQNLPVVDVLYFDAPDFDSVYGIIFTIFNRLGVISFSFSIVLFLLYKSRKNKDNEMLSLLFCFFLYVSMILIMMTGYKDLRYFTIFLFFLILHFVKYYINSDTASLISRWALYLSSSLLLLLSLARIYVNYVNPKEDFTKLIGECISSTDTLLIISDHANLSRVLSAELSVVSGSKTVMQPTNLSDVNVNELIDMYNITHLFFLDYSGSIEANNIGFVETRCESLYKTVRN